MDYCSRACQPQFTQTYYAINYTFDIGYLHGVAVSVDCTSYDILFLYKHNRIDVVPLFWWKKIDISALRGTLGVRDFS